ncbi:MAG: hypothetical protein WBG71_14490 [Leeuwenhoekiella sp.]
MEVKNYLILNLNFLVTKTNYSAATYKAFSEAKHLGNKAKTFLDRQAKLHTIFHEELQEILTKYGVETSGVEETSSDNLDYELSYDFNELPENFKKNLYSYLIETNVEIFINYKKLLLTESMPFDVSSKILRHLILLKDSLKHLEQLENKA